MSIPLETRVENAAKGFGVDEQLARHMLILANMIQGVTPIEELMREFRGDPRREAKDTEE